MTTIYLIGALKNRENMYAVEAELKKAGFEVFLDWLAPGEEADDKWKEYAQARGLTHKEALRSYAATHIFEFDKFHLDRADAAVMVMPCGKSGHLELGYTIGKGKPGYILFPDGELEDRWDVMHLFATGIAFSMEELVEMLDGQSRS